MISRMQPHFLRIAIAAPRRVCMTLAFLMMIVIGLPLAAADRPNVLMIPIDDLNHWVGHLGRHPQTRTPNMDRLARMGVSFNKAYCAAPACNPSRIALMSGIRPNTSGCYNNGQDYLRIILRYLNDEHQHKLGSPLPADDWTLVPTPRCVPQQQNGYDCGAFVCITTDCALQDSSLTCTQADIDIGRQRIALAILLGYAPWY